MVRLVYFGCCSGGDGVRKRIAAAAAEKSDRVLTHRDRARILHRRPDNT